LFFYSFRVYFFTYSFLFFWFCILFYFICRKVKEKVKSILFLSDQNQKNKLFLFLMLDQASYILDLTL